MSLEHGSLCDCREGTLSPFGTGATLLISPFMVLLMLIIPLVDHVFFISF